MAWTGRSLGLASEAGHFLSTGFPLLISALEHHSFSFCHMSDASVSHPFETAF